MMKNQASVFLKRVVSMVSSIAKAKAMAANAKSKTSAIKARLILFSIMRNKKVLLASISDKIHTILGRHDTTQQDEDHEEDDQSNSKAIILYNRRTSTTHDHQIMDDYINGDGGDDDDDDGGDHDKYPDLTHCLFDEEEFDDPGGSIIDMVKNSKEEEGKDFSLENEIDHVADLFIMRFHKQMRLQKLHILQQISRDASEKRLIN